MRVVGRSLEIPNQFPGVGIQRNNRTSPKVGSLSALTRHHRIRITRPPIDQVEVLVIGSRQPRHPSAVFHGSLVWPRLRSGFSFSRFGAPSPLKFAGLRIASFQIARNIDRVTTHADENVMADYHRGRGREVLHLLVSDFLSPALFSCARVERNEPS